MAAVVYDHTGAVVLHLVELLLALILSSLVLPALARNHRQFRRQRAADSLFFSAVLADWVLSAAGVLHYLVLLLRGAVRHHHSTSGVVLAAVFHAALVAELLWPAVLALFALRSADPAFLVRLHWHLAWLVGGIAAFVVTHALQPSQQRLADTRWNGVTVLLAVVVAAVAATVLGVAITLSLRRAQRVRQQQQLIRYLLLVLALELPFMLWIWLGRLLPSAFPDVALALVLLVPMLNAYNYGFNPMLDLARERRGHQPRKGTGQSTGDELLAAMDPDMVALEDLDGLSDIKFLAEGASGTVYKARWLGIDVAMKLIKLPNAGASDDLYQTIIQNSEQAFIEEASICARLRHPNITLFIRAGHYEGKLGILTEFCARGSLKDVLKQHFPLSWKRKVSLALHVAKGLTYLHARNPTYIHRDLKASNILVTDTWMAKLADFGISKVSNFVREPNGGPSASVVTVSAPPGSSNSINFAATQAMADITSFAGTWRWNAPEILKDPMNCRYSRSTDMYSFGMVLWEILSDGAIPFNAVRFDFEVRELVINSQRPQIKPSKGCPDTFVNLLLQCWAQNPSARPTAAQAAAELASILEYMGGTKSALPADSMDSSFDPSVFSFHSRNTERTTFASRITSLFRGGGSSVASSLLGSSTRGQRGGRRGLGLSSASLSSSVDFRDESNKFSMLGSPSSHFSNSTSSSTSSGSIGGLGFGLGTSTRRRGFSRENPLPSLHEYDYDMEPNPSDSSTAALSPADSALMSPIVELPMDAMLEDGVSNTFIELKRLDHVDDLGSPRSRNDSAASSASPDDDYDRDSERPGHADAASRPRGLTNDLDRRHEQEYPSLDPRSGRTDSSATTASLDVAARGRNLSASTSEWAQQREDLESSLLRSAVSDNSDAAARGGAASNRGPGIILFDSRYLLPPSQRGDDSSRTMYL
ncbi:hypothetical protein ATCC90586_004201 [Pythium insidiosum]|nr:hypothetical protein ATCC90586_004201 [Pythium insidiosum]